MTEAAVGSVLLVERRDAVATLILNRPDRRNAIDQAMRDALRATFDALDADRDVRVVVLTGAGPAFCAGVDLAEGPATAACDGADAGASGSPGPGAGVTARPPVAAPLWSFRKPVIAAINGAAVGGGLELALAADLRIAAAEARMGLTEARIGSLPGSAGTQLLPRIVGPTVAARMLFSGELIDAAEALRVGLVSDVVAGDELAAAAAELADRVAASAPLSLLALKQALRAAMDLPFAEGQALERRLWAELAVTADRAEGRAAFREKRPPRFEGR
jgi:E-phenylitaconyl-CoA hydratase